MQQFAPHSRRALLRLSSALVVSRALFKYSSLHAADLEWAQGTVFEAKTDAIERQLGDPGVPGVLVSNGRDMVRTDAEGHYRLPVWDGAPIFIIKPKGWSFALDPVTQISRHNSVHSLFGRPVPLSYPSKGPSGVPPVQIDFPLHRVDEQV